MTDQFDPMGPEGQQQPRPHGQQPGDFTERSLPILTLVAAFAALIIAIVAVVLVLDRRNTTETADTTTTALATTTAADASTTTAEPTTAPSTAPSTTSSTESTTSTTTEPTSTTDPAAYDTAVWPWPNAATGPAAQRFADPVDAAVSFAVDFVGFTDPVAGEFRAGDSRSGEVEIRNQADGPPTTVFVRQLGADNTWWVLGSATENIVIERPEALESIGNTMVVKGEARTFEGHVQVTLRADGLTDPVFEGNVTGRGDGVFGPFDETFAIDPVAVDTGAALFVSKSAKDGSIWEASVIRVMLDN